MPSLTGGAAPRRKALIRNLFDHAERYRASVLAPSSEHWAERQTEHRQLIDAAAEGDADRTADLLIHHYAHSLKLILSTLDPERDPTRIRETIEHVSPTAIALLD